MAIEYFSSIDLNQNEIQQPVVHVTGTIADADGVKGQLYTHSSNNTLLFHNGTEFIDLTAGDIQGITAGNGLSGGGTTGTISLAVDLNELATETSIAQADFVAMVDATDNGSGKITFSNFEDTIFSNMNSASSDVAVAAGGAITLANDCVDSAEIADGAIDTVHIADDQVTNAKLQYSSVQIGASTVALGDALTSLTALTDIDLTSGNKTIFDGVGSNTLTMGASGTTIAIPGNLTVAGTTTYKNETIQIVADNSLAFRAGDGNSNEIILTAADATGSDKTITLPNTTGTVALTSDITGTNSGTNTGDVTLGGSLDYITISNQVITRNAIDLTTDVTGTLPTANTAAKVTSIVAGDGIDVNNSGVGDVTVTAETATDGNAGIVTLASDSNALAGSGSGVVSAAQVASRYKTATIAASSVNAASNKRAFINHALGTYDIMVDLYLDSATLNYAKVHAEVTRTSDGSTDSTNHICVDFGNNIPADVKVVIVSARGADAVSPTYG